MNYMNTEYYRPFPSYLKPLFEREAKGEAINIKTVFFILMEIKLISQERFGT